MAMDGLILPDEREFISPVVDFNAFKEAAIAQRDSLRKAVGLTPPREFRYPEDIPPPPLHVQKRKLGQEEPVNQSCSADKTEKFAETFGFSKGEAAIVAEDMSLEQQATINNRGILFRRKVQHEDVPEDTELETLKNRRKTLEAYNPIKKKPITKHEDPEGHEKDKKNRVRIHAQIANDRTILKYHDFFENELKHSRLTNSDVAVVNDIVVTLVILKPHNHMGQLPDRQKTMLTPYWKFLLRGETTLVEMHGLFRCSADFGANLHVEEQVPQLHELSMIKYPSSVIFIHDTFYMPNDYRGTSEILSQIDVSKLQPLIDLSEPIRKWMKRKPEFGPTQVKDIADVKIKDLECRLGYPYVYIHQGSCEHVFFFTDLRLMDVQDYPLGFPQKLSDSSVEQYCITCHKRIAKWIVESESFPVIPAHMCDECYKGFHFTYRRRDAVPSRAYTYEDPSSLQY